MVSPKFQRHALLALLAAGLFGASAPLSKLLLEDIGPLTLAGLLYLGSGVGLLAFRIASGLFNKEAARESPLARKDWPWLLGAIACGGVAAPVLLLWGLADIGGSQASLLLSSEGLLTVLLAAAMFKEMWTGASGWVQASCSPPPRC